MNTDQGPWTVETLHQLLAQFEVEVRAARLTDNSVGTYVDMGQVLRALARQRLSAR